MNGQAAKKAARETGAAFLLAAFTLELRMNDEQVELAVKEKGLTAPRVTKTQIDQMMEGVTCYVHHIPETTVTVATAFSAAGFMLACETSAAVSLENFNADIGKDIAVGKVMDAARDKLWELEGYRLSSKLHCGAPADSSSLL